jgi:crotonobetainyl-CoA:carnitine CoA-transferase CaiB-like acyl-CoA transferase
MEVANRGKRSIGIDLSTEGGRQTLYKLVGSADVFLTSLRSRARRKLGIQPEDIQKLNPSIIYGRGTGYGLLGPHAEKGGYDWPVTWCRGGIAHRMTPPGAEPPTMVVLAAKDRCMSSND